MLLYFIKLTYNEWYIQDLLQKDNKQFEVILRDLKHKIIWWWRDLFYQMYEDFTNTSQNDWVKQ